MKVPKIKNFIRHFLANSADRPEICATMGGIMQWILGRSAEFAQKWLVNFQFSNGSKIARMAPISMIFGQNWSRRSKFFFPKFSRGRKKFHDDENFAATKKFRNARTIERMRCQKIPGKRRSRIVIDGYKIDAVICSKTPLLNEDPWLQFINKLYDSF